MTRTELIEALTTAEAQLIASGSGGFATLRILRGILEMREKTAQHQEHENVIYNGRPGDARLSD
jgi:hypothetical protein